MQHETAQILAAIQAGDTPGEDFAHLKLPESYRAVTVHADEAEMFAGLPSRDKDPRRSLHVEDVATPELGPGEAIVAVMASAINYNSVWTSIFEPVSTFSFLKRYGKLSELTRRHDLPYHVIGSDLAGVVLRTGPGVNKWKPGDEVVAHCLSVELEDADGHGDTMLDPQQRIWGFETNFGGLAHLALVKSNQLMPKPAHLTWEEAAVPGLVNSTAYRQLVSKNGAAMKQGDVVLIWGASGGLGSYATQMALNGGATPVCVVSSPDKAEICRKMGAELIIDRAAEGYRFWKPTEAGGTAGSADGPEEQDPKEWQRFGAKIRELTGGEDPDIVFEHPGRETFGASVYVARRGGTIVTCASTSGFQHTYDNRYLWMNLKRIVGSHFANYREAWEANRLIDKGMIHPTLSKSYILDETGQAAYDVHKNLHQGKVGVLCLAPEEGLGVRNEGKREVLLSAINRFRSV
jgi:crotonyl-CoA reductase